MPHQQKQAEAENEASSNKKGGKPSKDKTSRVPQKEKISFDLKIRDFPFTEKQKAFIELAMHKDTRVIFLDGPAGSSKTCLAVYVALQMLQSRKCGEIVYVRNLVESSSKGMGYLPGEADDKFSPFAKPLFDKLEEFLVKAEIDRLKKEDRIHAIPVNYLRGASFNALTCIFDETQNATMPEIVTCLTRLGKFSKFIFLGDHQQSDLNMNNGNGNGRSGFSRIIEAFDDEESREKGIFCIKFDKSDILRSELLKFIIEKLEQKNITHNS